MRRRRRSRRLALQPLLPFHRANLILAVEPQLIVESFERGEIRFHLFGQFTIVLTLVLSNPLLVGIERSFDLLQLRSEKIRRANRLLFAALGVFVDVK